MIYAWQEKMKIAFFKKELEKKREKNKRENRTVGQ